METHRPSSPPLARMLTAASAPVFLPTVGPLPISPSDGSGNACTKVLYAWHHTPESSLPLIHLNSYLGFLCLDVSQTGLLRSFVCSGNSRCYQAPNLSRLVQMPLPGSLPRLPPAKEPSSYAGLKHTSVHTIVHPSMCAGYYSRGSSNQGQGLIQWLARAQLSRL